MVATPAAANHQQSVPNGGTLTFDHKSGGNEWWVEVVVTSSVAVSKVEVMDTGGAWATMTAHPEWGAGTYSLSYRVEPGNLVTFRATTANGAVTSCPFTHPGGVEQCSAPPPPPPPPGTFDATFNSVRGNQYWVQAQVLPNSGNTIAKVDVTMDGGATWKPLAKQSWGTSMYAASYNMPQGTVVQLRATSGAGATDLSACYQWIPAKDTNAATVACGTVPPPPTGLEWHSYFQGQVQGHIEDVAIGDADRDGRPETYASGTGTWRMSPDGDETKVSDVGGHIAVGDADNDGKAEVYVTGYDYATGQGSVHRFSWSGTAWTETIIHRGPLYESFGPITVGDVDNDGLRELYMGREASSAASILRLAKTSAGTWQAQVVADFGDDGKFLDIRHIWVGDGDGDGRRDLVADTGGYGYSSVFFVEKEATWSFVRLGSHGQPGGVVAGDIDGDGRGEVAATDDFGVLHVFRHASGVWTETEHELLDRRSASDLALGDPDNDGRSELYATTWDGGTFRIAATGTSRTLQAEKIAEATNEDGYSGPSLIVIGDADGDGRREYLADISYYLSDPDRTTLYRQEFEAKQTFTFSEEKGNNWWLEVRITSNYPIYAVMATFNCDTSRDPADLSYRADIGKWVLGSTYIPPGTKVTFDAYGQWGAGESQGFIHPNGTPTTGC